MTPLPKIRSQAKWSNLKQKWDQGYCQIYVGYPSETHLKLKSCKNSFVHNICFNCPIGLKCCTEHGSDTAVLCAKFQRDRSTETWVMGKRDLSLRWISDGYLILHKAPGSYCGLYYSNYLMEQVCFFHPTLQEVKFNYFCLNFGLNNDLVECSTQLLQNICKNYEIDPIYLYSVEKSLFP